MEIQKDFKDLLELFVKHKVEFVLVGAYALAFHGAPRFTGDLDILVKPSIENAKKVISALKDFGFGALNLTINDFTTEKQVVQLGHPPVRIDILTSISGLEWNIVDEGKIEGICQGIKLNFIGLKEFLINKKTLGRHKDFADIEALGKLNSKD